jgi:Uncharacterised nucleotidyltransferase
VGKVLIGATAEQLEEEIDGFFMRTDKVWRTMDRLTTRLRQEGIPHAVLGGMSLALHGYARVTADVDILTTRDGLDMVHQRLVGLGYVLPFPGARKRLRDATTGVSIDFITSGEYPGDGKPKAIQFPDPSDSVERLGYSVLSLPRIIESKIVTGLTVPHRQLRDLADVQALITELHLPRTFAEQLHPTVRDEFDRLWRLAQVHDPEFD